ncbi:hypothetical protein NPIL_80121 [Nephila pilipes]|uniref:Uncharacterized protein n=1 Tax=Nephila pilipes TaxID=299642 RepID=A0A8X6Q0P1_NEPPI|nr:hypothetical protein NPIL_80121 [Nephila pilipes]
MLVIALMSSDVEGHHGPILFYKAGRGGGAGGALATLLAAGAVAKLLQSHSGGGESHQVHPIFIPVPVGHGGGHY